MDKDRIEGRHGAMSWHNTAKSAGMPVEVNAVAVRRSNVQLPGEIPPLSGGGKSAEAIVVEETSRGLKDARLNNDTGETHPMKGRTNEEGIDPATDKPTDNAPERGELERRGGGKHGAPQERAMIEDILEPENLAAAWKRVKANKGAPGIDGMTVGDFPAFARVHWPRIATAIREGTYRPSPVKRVWIPKPGGSKRPLGICPRLAQLLQAQLHLYGGVGFVTMGQAAGEVVLLETMEAATHAPPESARVGGQPQQCAHGDAQPQRLLADESE